MDSHNICPFSSDLLHLAEYLQSSSRCGICENLLFFQGCLIFHCMYPPHFVHSPIDGHLDCCDIVIRMNKQIFFHIFLSGWAIIYAIIPLLMIVAGFSRTIAERLGVETLKSSGFASVWLRPLLCDLRRAPGPSERDCPKRGLATAKMT